MTASSCAFLWRLLALGAAAATLAMGKASAAEARPLAMIELIMDAPAASVFDFDYLYAGDTVDLRPNGQMTVAYFDNCIVERFRGGVIRIRKDGAEVSNGAQSAPEMRACQTAALAIDTEATEAGVSVKRVDKLKSLLPPEALKEVTVAAARPRFTWPRSRTHGKPVHVTVNLLEASPKTLVWQSDVEGAQVAYPADAPALIRGLPYEIVVSFDRGADLVAVFSIDPDLALPVSPLTSVIPLGL